MCACGTHRGVGGLYPVLVWDGRVHVNQTKEVKAQWRSEAAEQPEMAEEKSNNKITPDPKGMSGYPS